MKSLKAKILSCTVLRAKNTAAELGHKYEQLSLENFKILHFKTQQMGHLDTWTCLLQVNRTNEIPPNHPLILFLVKSWKKLMIEEKLVVKGKVGWQCKFKKWTVLDWLTNWSTRGMHKRMWQFAAYEHWWQIQYYWWLDTSIFYPTEGKICL